MSHITRRCHDDDDWHGIANNLYNQGSELEEENTRLKKEIASLKRKNRKLIKELEALRIEQKLMMEEGNFKW